MNNGKYILLTGASGGIGSCTASMLAKQGANMILVDRDINQLEILLDSIDQGDNDIRLLAADLGKNTERERIVHLAGKYFPCLDVLINCAGINQFSMFYNMDDTVIETMININLVAPMILTKRCIPLLHKSRHGQIINFGSTFGSIGYPGFVTYSATKFAMRGFTEALRRELSNTGISISYIAPRATKTTINSGPVYKMNAALGVKMDDPAVVAVAILNIIDNGKPVNCYLGWPEKLFVKINSLFPGLVDGSLRKQLETILLYAKP